MIIGWCRGGYHILETLDDHKEADDAMQKAWEDMVEKQTGKKPEFKLKHE